MATASPTRIGNRACILLGTAQRIASIDDATPLAQAIKDLFEDCRDEVLAEHPWNPAIRRAVLALSAATVELGEWEYAYELPADCLRWLPWSKDHELYVDGVREGNLLLTNEAEPPTARYIGTLDDLTRWSPGMREALAGKIAMWLAAAGPVRDEVSAQKASKIYEDALSRGRRQDGLESGNREREAEYRSNWLGARNASLPDPD